jgi:hypothetical protein
MRTIRINRTRRRLSAAGATLACAALLLTASPAHAMNGNVPDSRAPDAGGEITAMYWHGLNRDPDPAGLSQYMGFASQNCRWGVLSASFQILNSAEAHNAWHNNPQTLAGMLYAALLNRPPDPGGLQAYTAAITQRGLPWATASMMASPEYNTRLANICHARNETATMYTWDSAQAFAKSITRNNAFNNALLCVGAKALFKIDYLKDSDTPVGEFISTSLDIEKWIVDTFKLDGSCGAALAFIRAAVAIYQTVNGSQYNPVFIQYSVGGPSNITHQRKFTIRVGPDPAHWTGYSGSSW